MRYLKSFNSRLALYATIALATFGLLALILPISILLPIMNAVSIGIVGTVTVVFMPLIMRSIRDKELDKVSQLMIGMLLMWFSLLGSRFANVYVILTKDFRIANTPIIAFLAYMAILGGALHITAPGIIGSDVKTKKMLGIGLIIGAALSILVLWLQAIL